MAGEGGVRQEDAWEGLSTGAGSCGRGSWSSPISVTASPSPPAPSVTWCCPVWPMEVQIWCEGQGGCHARMGHTEMFTQAHRDTNLCV